MAFWHHDPVSYCLHCSAAGACTAYVLGKLEVSENQGFLKTDGNWLALCLLFLPPLSFSFPSHSPHLPRDLSSEKSRSQSYCLSFCVCSFTLPLTLPHVCLLWFGYFVSMSTGPVSLCTSLSKLPQSVCEISRHTNEALNRHSLGELGWIPRLSGPVMEMEMQEPSF